MRGVHFMASSRVLKWFAKNFRNSSSICQQDLEKMDAYPTPTSATDMEVVKRTCAKPETRWTCLANWWLCEAPWVQTGTNPWNLYLQRRCFAISESQNCKWSIVKLAQIFYGGVSDNKNRAADVGAISNQQLAPAATKNNLWNWRNVEFVKSQILWKLNNFMLRPKNCTPPDFGKENSAQTKVIAQC